MNTTIEAGDGRFYGTSGGGNGQDSLMFRMTKSGDFKVLLRFERSAGSGICWCGIMQGSDGIIYGFADGGGSSGRGLIFALDASLPIPKPQALQFQPASGPPGTQVQIWGNNLFGASVKFHGGDGTNVSNGGPNYVFATVPSGAASGPITVTTPGGTSKTKIDFTVTSAPLARREKIK